MCGCDMDDHRILGLYAYVYVYLSVYYVTAAVAFWIHL